MKIREDPLKCRFLFFIQKIVFTLAAGINEIFRKLQIFMCSRYAIKLHKCKLDFLMPRITVNLALLCSEGVTDQISKSGDDIQKFLLSGCFVVCHCSLDHMPGCIKLMTFHKIRPAKSRFLDRKISVQVSVRLLCPSDQVDCLVCKCFQLLIPLPAQRKTNRFQPFGNIRILKNGSLEFAFAFSCCNFEVLNTVTGLHVLQTVI